MDHINRREFAGAALGALGTPAVLSAVSAEDRPQPKLPTVRWGPHVISRVLAGHNPIKGVSHFSAELSREMHGWFASNPDRGLQLLRRCEQSGINTCQMGGAVVEKLLAAHRAKGGRLQWIATFYSRPGQGKEELARLMKMDPKPIGIQQLGNTSDRLMREGKIDRAQENLKMFRDAGVLVGLGSHNHEVIDYAEQKGWDVDFYQCCFYRSWFGLDPAQKGEVFEEKDRQAMVRTIRKVAKPCIAFKVLGANRHCRTPAAVEGAIRFALDNIKPSDLVLLGMWQKHRDQVGENVGYALKALGIA